MSIPIPCVRCLRPVLPAEAQVSRRALSGRTFCHRCRATLRRLGLLEQYRPKASTS